MVLDMNRRERPSPEELLKRIGVEDLIDGESYLSPISVAEDSGEGNRILVRGASRGGSPVLNIATRAIIAGVILVFTGSVYGVKRLMSPPAEAATGSGHVSTDLIACRVWFWQRSAKGILALAPEIATGSIAAPREATALAAAGGETFWVGQDRVDRFTPLGAQLAIRYAGLGPSVRSVSISFEKPVQPCRALMQTGLLSASARFVLRDGGRLEPIELAKPHPFFEAGGIVRVQGAEGRFLALQLEGGLPGP